MKSKALVTGAALLALCATAFAPLCVQAKEYILTGVKPNRLVLIDPAKRAITRIYTIPGGGSPAGIVTSPDGKTAYVTTNHTGSLVGIDLDSGKEVFHADFSDGDFSDVSSGALRVRSFYGLEISPDGKELFVSESPVRLLRDEYKVEDTRIAVYRTDGGLAAEPVRLLPLPRRTTNIMMSTDGTKLYANSWDLYTLDPKDGKVLKVDKILNWDRKNFAPAGVFNVWNQFEQAHMFVTPYYTARTDPGSGNPPTPRTGLLTLDLKTGDIHMNEFEDFSAIMFSSVLSPVHRNEVYSTFKTLTKSDIEKNILIKRVTLPRPYYCINISADGREVYVAGAGNDIGVYSTGTLKRIGEIKMPGGADMAGAWIRMVERP